VGAIRAKDRGTRMLREDKREDKEDQNQTKANEHIPRRLHYDLPPRSGLRELLAIMADTPG